MFREVSMQYILELGLVVVDQTQTCQARCLQHYLSRKHIYTVIIYIVDIMIVESIVFNNFDLDKENHMICLTQIDFFLFYKTKNSMV